MAFAIRVLRLLEKFSSIQLTVADEYAVDLDVIDADSIRTIVEHRADEPVQLHSTTDVSVYEGQLNDMIP